MTDRENSLSALGYPATTVAKFFVPVAVWSPGLDANGNSKLGKKALQMLVNGTGWNVFGA